MGIQGRGTEGAFGYRASRKKRLSRQANILAAHLFREFSHKRERFEELGISITLRGARKTLKGSIATTQCDVRSIPSEQRFNKLRPLRTSVIHACTHGVVLKRVGHGVRLDD